MYIDKLVAHIKKQQWRIVSPAYAYKDPIAEISGANLEYNYQGRVAAIAHSKGVEKKKLRHESESDQYIDRLLKERKVFSQQ